MGVNVCGVILFLVSTLSVECSAGLEYPCLSAAHHCIALDPVACLRLMSWHSATVEWSAGPGQASQFLSRTRQCKHRQQLLLLVVVIYSCVLCMEMRCLMINLMGSWGDAPS